MQFSSCQERAGFLFAHDCSRPAAQQCTRCAKPICAGHTHSVNAELLCTGCARNEDDNEDVEDTGSETGSSGEAEDATNPYLYSSYYYRDYGYYGHGAWGHDIVHDPDDFTEADGEPLRTEGSERFEEDMGGS